MLKMILRIVVFCLFLGSSALAQAQTPSFEECGQNERSAQWGPFSVGVEIKLGIHRSVRGVKNWNASMDDYAGHHARVIELAGVDGVGCLGVRVSIDGGEYFWRVRDALVVPTLAASMPLAANDPALEQCGGTLPEYGPLTVGAVVSLKRHRVYRGDDDWSDEMDAYVGQEAHVTELIGVDDMGCAGVHVDIDGGEWFWRVRDLNLDALSTPPPP